MGKYIEIPSHKKPYVKQKAKDVLEQEVLMLCDIGCSWGDFNYMVIKEDGEPKQQSTKQVKKATKTAEQLPYNHSEMYLGREFKSFHEVTDTLGWKRTKSGSNGRLAQEKVIAQYCRLERVPNTKSKYHIVEVFETMKPKLDKRKNIDTSIITDSVQKQIMLVLANALLKRKEQSPNNHVYLDQQFTFSTGQLIEYVGLVNPSFRNIRHNIKQYSKSYNLNDRHVSDIVNSTNNNAKNIVKNALDTLNGRYLSYTEGINISFKKQYDLDTGEVGYIQDVFANTVQISFIKVLCERTVLKHYGLNSVKEIFSPIKNTKNLSLARFYTTVVELARKLCVATDENGNCLFSHEIRLLEDMEYYYSSYQISTFVPILEEFEQNNSLTYTEKKAIATLFDQDDYFKYLATLGDTQQVNDMNLNHTIKLAKNRRNKNSNNNYSYRQTMTDVIIEKVANDIIHMNYNTTNEDRVFNSLKELSTTTNKLQIEVLETTETVEVIHIDNTIDEPLENADGSYTLTQVQFEHYQKVMQMISNIDFDSIARNIAM